MFEARPQMIMNHSLPQESPFDGAAARQVKKAYTEIDKLSIRIGIALRQGGQRSRVAHIVSQLGVTDSLTSLFQTVSHCQIICFVLHGKVKIYVVALSGINLSIYYIYTTAFRLFFTSGFSWLFLIALQTRRKNKGRWQTVRTREMISSLCLFVL